MHCTFLTHPEVVVDPAVPIEDWGLSPQGAARAGRAASVLPRPERLVSSTERKALDTAAVLARSWQLDAEVDARLGEMDRSATGYLDPQEFEPTVDAFFARPLESVRGWERAVDAQRRIEQAVRQLVAETPQRSIVFVAHGGVGALLLASLTRVPIIRELDQPGMGSMFRFDPTRWEALSTWQRIAWNSGSADATDRTVAIPGQGPGVKPGSSPTPNPTTSGASTTTNAPTPTTTAPTSETSAVSSPRSPTSPAARPASPPPGTAVIALENRARIGSSAIPAQ